MRAAVVASVEGVHEFASGPDLDPSPDSESLVVSSQGSLTDDFLYGDLAVRVPHRARCDRYRMDAVGTVTYLDSWPCAGSGS